MRPEILYPLFADISSLKGVGIKTYKLLTALLNGNYIKDLLFHLPSNLIDRSYQPLLKDAIPGRICTFKVRVIEHSAPKNRHQPYRVVVGDDTGLLTLVFFKIYADSIIKNLPIGATRIISGKLENFNNSLQMTHPDYIVPESEVNSLPLIEPIYPLTAGISSKMLNKYISQALSMIPELPEWQDAEFIKKQGWDCFQKTLYRVHIPKKLEDIEPFSKEHTRLAYDELLANQLTLAIARERVKKQKGISIKGNGKLREAVLKKLPFSLTCAQEKVLKEIYNDQAKPFRMLRLLQGDVGSGKTIVALMAMLNVVESGGQAAIMAPTEILAKQHFETIGSLCSSVGIRSCLLTGKTKNKERLFLKNELAEGKIDIVVGTHALFQDDVAYRNLCLVVVDEQHRFGVHQRLSLSAKGKLTDVLVMTATPIPRTLVLTAYGDMEYSKIDQLPDGRKPVDTRVLPLTKQPEVILALQRKLKEGCRAYWVCPLIEESEKSDLAAAEARFSDLQKIFGNQVGLIHGKMKEKDKDDVMKRFKCGDLSLLVATTVIEVGVNVPEATLMIIEHAERFGLAQLHQLRGRIKRGFQNAVCLLLYGQPLGETALARLDVMRQTEDGFIIAEKDLELRGGGEILGTKQSGFTSFRLADLNYHSHLLDIAYRDAKFILNKDPELKTPRGQALRTLLYLFEEDLGIRRYHG